MNKVFRYGFLFSIPTLLVAGYGCNKESNTVPVVYTDIYLYTTDPAFSPLNAIGGYAYLAGGSKGIIVYRKSQTEFMAYDRHCTYNVANGDVVAVDPSGLLAADAACKSRFLLTDGSPNSGPAVNLLKHYQTAFDQTVLHIFN